MSMNVQGIREASIEPTAPGEGGISEGCVLLRAGLNKTGKRMYTPEFVQEHLSRFDGAFCSADHPSLSEGKDLPERSMLRLAAVVRNPRWDEAMNAAIGDVEYLNTPAGQTMREAFRNDVVRERAGMSIYWSGPVQVERRKLKEAGGRAVDVPIRLLGDGQFDVDFVTRPSAGGKVGPLREGVDDAMLSDVTLEQLTAERPDLIEAARQGYVRQEDMPPAPPDNTAALAEANRRIEALEQRNLALEAQGIVRDKLAECDLPAKAKAYVAKHFADVVNTAGLAEAIDAEIAEVKELGLAESGRVQGITGEPPAAVFDSMAGVRDLWGIPEPK